MRWKCGISALAEKYISLGTKSLGINDTPHQKVGVADQQKKRYLADFVFIGYADEGRGGTYFSEGFLDKPSDKSIYTLG